MKIRISLAALVLLATLSSCSEKEGMVQEEQAPRFHAVMETMRNTETRAFVDQSNHVYWKADDRVSIFYKSTYNRQYTFVGRTGTSAGDFEPVPNEGMSVGSPIETGFDYAIYPYHRYNACDYDGTLTVTFPSERTYNNQHNKSIGINPVLVSRALADEDNKEFMFKHAAGYVGLKFYGDDVTISSVAIKSNNDEPLSGYPYVVFSEEDDVPYLTFTDDSEGENSTTIICDPPIKVGATADEATTIWFTLPPAVLTKGFTFTVTDINGGKFSKSRNSSYVVERKTMKTMAALKVVPEGGSDTPVEVPVTGVQLGSSSLSLEVGGSANLTATVLPSNATNKSVSWSSSNTGVATVDNNGKVTALAAGSAVITVTTTDGGKTATCTVTVTDPAVPVQSVSLDKTTLDLNVGENSTLVATVLPENADNKAVTWSSGNTTVATVDASGKVTAVAAGSAVITVTTTDGGKTATCTVTVIADKDPNHAGDPVEIEEDGNL